MASISNACGDAAAAEGRDHGEKVGVVVSGS